MAGLFLSCYDCLRLPYPSHLDCRSTFLIRHGCCHPLRLPLPDASAVPAWNLSLRQSLPPRHPLPHPSFLDLTHITTAVSSANPLKIDKLPLPGLHPIPSRALWSPPHPRGLPPPKARLLDSPSLHLHRDFHRVPDDPITSLPRHHRHHPWSNLGRAPRAGGSAARGGWAEDCYAGGVLLSDWAGQGGRDGLVDFCCVFAGALACSDKGVEQEARGLGFDHHYHHNPDPLDLTSSPSKHDLSYCPERKNELAHPRTHHSLTSRHPHLSPLTCLQQFKTSHPPISPI